MTTASLRWGLLSTARINDKLLAGARATEAATVVAVASRSRERADAYASSQGIARAHGSYEELLADPEVDAVYVPLPNSDHVPWSVRALEAGKHVLCEKPMARAVGPVVEAFDAADRAGRVLSEAFMWRHHPQTARLVELLGDGAVGPLRGIRSSFHFHLTDPDDLRMQASLEGGALMDLGCYCVSAARLLAGGEPLDAVASQVVGGHGVDVALSGVLRFGGDVVATFDCGLRTPRGTRLEVVGEAGTLRALDPWHGVEPVVELDTEAGVERIECEVADPYRLELEDLAAAAAGERPPLLGRDDALGQARTIEALYRAAEEGRRVQVS